MVLPSCSRAELGGICGRYAAQLKAWWWFVVKTCKRAVLADDAVFSRAAFFSRLDDDEQLSTLSLDNQDDDKKCLWNGRNRDFH